MKFDRRDSLHLPPELNGRTRYLAETDRAVVKTIHLGILFVMAFWSGQSILAFRRLKEVLLSRDQESRLELVVVDADGCPDLYDLWAEAHQAFPSGSGEAAWIKEGRIVLTSGRGYNPDCFDANTVVLLYN